jgi:hypothetical protein
MDAENSLKYLMKFVNKFNMLNKETDISLIKAKINVTCVRPIIIA